MPAADPLKIRQSGRLLAIRHERDRLWVGRYDRARDLPRLLPLLACDLDVTSREAHLRLLGLLRRALRAERARARERHWSYDPGRHAALVSAARAELAALDQWKRQPTERHSPA